jgi:uncharacterized membrane-anchored protein
MMMKLDEHWLALRRFASSPAMLGQIMLGMFLCCTFLLPGLTAHYIFQIDPTAAWTKITACLVGAVAFVAMWVTYGYFSTLVVSRDAGDGEKGKIE